MKGRIDKVKDRIKSTSLPHVLLCDKPLSLLCQTCPPTEKSIMDKPLGTGIAKR